MRKYDSLSHFNLALGRCVESVFARVIRQYVDNLADGFVELLDMFDSRSLARCALDECEQANIVHISLKCLTIQ